MSKLVAHAEFELRRAGLFDESGDYGGQVGRDVLDLVRLFAAQGHSGFSAGLTLKAFDLVARFKSLTPITSDPSEWNDVSEISGGPLWQNNRQPSCFSRDGGNTHYDVDLDGPCTSAPSP